MKRILFLIHDLGPGGAEKVLINLVNNMDLSVFDITVMPLFDIGVNKGFLKQEIHYKPCFSIMPRGNTHIMKAFSPRQLHKWLVRECYDIEVSYLEGPTTRIVSGCTNNDTKKVAWVHGEMSPQGNSKSFRNEYELQFCYNSFDRIICVSEDVRRRFHEIVKTSTPSIVLYNTNDSTVIRRKATEHIEPTLMVQSEFNLVAMGKLITVKGFDRLLRITKQLVLDGYSVHSYIIGDGPKKNEYQRFIQENGLESSITLLGYQMNPYKYLSKSDLFVCSSFSEGFSTAATEALIVGTPICTVDVPGMHEMLGDNEFGVITENDEESLYFGIRELLSSPEKLRFYKKQAELRGNVFSKEKTVKDVQEMLLAL